MNKMSHFNIVDSVTGKTYTVSLAVESNSQSEETHCEAMLAFQQCWSAVHTVLDTRTLVSIENSEEGRKEHGTLRCKGCGYQHRFPLASGELKYYSPDEDGESENWYCYHCA